MILLNNDTQVFPDFVEQLCRGMRTRPKAFSGGRYDDPGHDHGKLDAAGDYYSALGWAFAGGKGKDPRRFASPRKVFSVCAGAAVYRTDLLRKTGLFDEEHFAYLEDLDIGYRARIAAMRTGISRRRRSTMWAAEPAVPATIFSRSAILPEIMSILSGKICRFCRGS